jgi:hypothetical protein
MVDAQMTRGVEQEDATESPEPRADYERATFARAIGDPVRHAEFAAADFGQSVHRMR